MKSLLLIAHGSRREASNEEVRRLAARIGSRGELAGMGFAQVASAFLELAEPSIPDGIEQCIKQGATEVVVLPYFLSAGRHVAEDIPAEVAVKQAEHPEINIRIASYLGLAEELPAVLLRLAGED